MNTEETEWCTITPIYPKTAYAICIVATPRSGIGNTVIIPLHELTLTLDSAAETIPSYIQQLSEQDLSVPDETIIIQLSFDRLFPLKKEYWQGPSTQYALLDRIRLFIQATNHPTFYDILVTPTIIGTEKTMFCPTLPFLQTSVHILDTFMRTSDQVVDTRAKDAAIYTISALHTFNWKTRAISDIKHTPSSQIL